MFDLPQDSLDTEVCAATAADTLPADMGLSHGAFEENETYSDSIQAALKIQEGETIYGMEWYPGMTALNPVSCCFATTSRVGGRFHPHPIPSQAIITISASVLYLVHHSGASNTSLGCMRWGAAMYIPWLQRCGRGDACLQRGLLPRWAEDPGGLHQGDSCEWTCPRAASVRGGLFAICSMGSSRWTAQQAIM